MRVILIVLVILLGRREGGRERDYDYDYDHEHDRGAENDKGGGLS